MTNSKAKAQKSHAKRRASERLGVELNKEGYRALVAQIRDGRAKFLERQSLRVSLFAVDVAGSPAVAVYDRQRKTIATLLTMEMFNQRNPEPSREESQP